MRQVRRRWLGAALAALVLVACSDEDLRDEDDVVVTAGAEQVFALRSGDCLDPDPGLSGEISEIAVVPCAQPHTQEVYAAVEHPDDAYPGAAAVATFADATCIEELDAQLGLSLDDGVFISYLLPTFDGWNRDGAPDREIVCVLVFPDREAATGSVVAGDPEARIERAQPAPPRIDDAGATGDATSADDRDV